ncbi:hypothetical protein L5515_016722 [Caenorhabditis briggsae]|uniref:Uncharacterized protein n=1 Tax=Caenorhabditis briggsae TaxID=6238 RepID=A0AAE9FHQ9_CAEBR|nr:hypothetical protein L5515_016722 [Caenorhabditis briggsae]
MASSSNQTSKRIRPVAVVVGTPRQVQPPRPMTPPPVQQNVFVVQEPQFGEREEMMGAGGWFEPIGPQMIPEPNNPVAQPMIGPQHPIIQGMMIIPPPAIMIQFGPPQTTIPAPHPIIQHPMHQAFPGNNLVPPPMGQFHGPAHHLGPHQFFQEAQMFQPQLQFQPVFQPPPPVHGPNQMVPGNGVAMNMVPRPRRVGRPTRNMQHDQQQGRLENRGNSH